MNSADAASERTSQEGTSRNLISISPFFIVKDLRASIRYHIEHLGFQLSFEGPDESPFFAPPKPRSTRMGSLGRVH